MDRIFIRNFFLFVILLLVCAGTLFYTLVSGERTLSRTDTLVTRTYDIILRAEDISSEVGAMLAAQRGFLITESNTFKDTYEQKKSRISENIARLTELVGDNQSQISRLNEIRFYFNELTLKLEERIEVLNERAPPAPPSDIQMLAPGIAESNSGLDAQNGSLQRRLNEQLLGDVEMINNLRDNIERLNATFLSEEYKLLEYRVQEVSQKKSQYFNSLLIGVVGGTIILLLFNSFLLNAQRKRSLIETSLKDTEARYKMAVDGANDGIFDWDVKTGEVFYSKVFFTMLGYDSESYTGTPEDFEQLIHLNDRERVWNEIQDYLAAKRSEYSTEFRMKKADNSWAWIQAKGKAIFDDQGKALRLVGSHSDITSQKVKQEKLQIEKQQAEQANRAKSDFLAHMSHEIRTPLTAISGIAEIMSVNQANFDDKQKQLTHTLYSSTAALKDLINDILDFSKIESDELELANDVFNLGQLFESVVSMMALRANEKGINFVFDYERVSDFDFRGDEVRFRQILVNLIGNALKFTEAGGVTVRAYQERRDDMNSLRIDVTDTGIGIAAKHFNLVFERFKQADASVSRKYGGTGLGLPISKKLAQLMSGDIVFSSQVGKGSTFSLILPFDSVEEREGAVQPESSRKLSEKIIASAEEMNRILLVEDYEGNIVVLGYILDELGLSYDIARTGQEGVDLWKTNHYELILMDVQMPEMDGFTATRKIREIENRDKLNPTPIIGMTAHALVGDKDKCIEAGMDAYLPKPIVETELKKQILHIMNTNHETQDA